MTLESECKSCGWTGNPLNLTFGEKVVDHETWVIWSCPQCDEEVKRKPEATV